MKDLERRGLEIIARVAGRSAGELRAEQNLVGDLQIDSPKALQLLLQLEDDLGLEISDEEAAKMDTVGDVLAFLASRG